MRDLCEKTDTKICLQKAKYNLLLLPTINTFFSISCFSSLTKVTLSYSSVVNLSLFFVDIFITTVYNLISCMTDVVNDGESFS